jgi:hypothetical protein
MGERGVATEIVQGGITIKTVHWGRRALPWISTIGEREGGIETVQWDAIWAADSRGEGCYYGDSTMGERGVTMDTVQ